MALKLERAQDSEDVKRYARVVAKAWIDSDYKARLLADPRPVLGDAGLEIPGGAEVRVVDSNVTSIDASGGVITFGLPSAPKGGLGDESLNWKIAPQDGRGCGCAHTTACAPCYTTGNSQCTGPFCAPEY